MKKKIAFLTASISIVLALMVFLAGVLAVKSNNTDKAKAEAKSICETVAALYSGDNEVINNFDKSYRITVIDASGKVLCDSEYKNVEGMENHIAREEIIAALSGKNEAFVRKSSTTGNDLFYFAVKKEGNFASGYVFIRVANEVKSVDDFVIKTAAPIFGVLVAAIIAAVLLSMVIAEKSTAPLKKIEQGLKKLNEGSFEGFEPIKGDAEISSLISSLDDLAKKLSDAFLEAKFERDRLGVIVESINDGVVLLSHGDISFANSAALEIFGATKEVVGKKIVALTSSSEIINAEKAAENGEFVGFETTVGARILVGSFKTVNETGVTLALFCVMTAERNNQKNRSEFFANAGHELKTPLTAIIGFNELIVASDEEQKLAKFTSQIEANSKRMVNLVNDMLKLSELENGSAEKLVKVDLRAISEKVKESLDVVAKEKQVELTIEGEATAFATEDKIYELIKNLAENAIKYNENGGYAKIKLSSDKKTAKLIVEDNGIGIPEADSQRIFERFYRVEKGRSRLSGGTGLGLAIVKHIVLSLGGEISIKSKLGVGTAFTVTLNVEDSVD